MPTTSYIEAFEFQPNLGNVLSDLALISAKGGVVALRYVANPSAQAPGQPSGKYTTTSNVYVRTRAFTPGALSSWGFVEIFGETDTVDEVQITFIELRIWDGTEALYWDGGAWSSAASTDFNTLKVFNANLAAYTGAEISIEARLRTTDTQFTPTLSGFCLKWTGEKFSFMREWVVNTVLRSLKDSIRPLTDYPVDHTGGNIISLSDHPLDAAWNLTDVVEVYDHTNDPDHTTNLFSSFDSVESLITLTVFVDAGVRLWIKARYAPQVAVTTSSDYFEGGKSPAILITMVSPQWGGKSIGARGPSAFDVTTPVPSGTVYPNPISMIDIDFTLATVAPTSQDLIVLNEAVGSWLDAHPTLRSRAIDHSVKMQSGNFLDWNTAQDDVKDPRLAVATFSLRNVPFIGDALSGGVEGASKAIGAVDAGDPAAPGVGYAVSSVNVVSTVVGSGGNSTMQITE